MAGNPLQAAYETQRHASTTGLDSRDELIHLYGFAIPTDEALQAIADASPNGVIELGAGTGYWASLLHDRGIDVVAYDVAPPPSTENRWFAGAAPWFPVGVGDETMAQRHGERTLLLVWPTRNEEWAATAVALFHRAGGDQLVYVGEGPGGHTGDDQLHALLGSTAGCVACAYGLVDVACTCGVQQLWQRQATVELPHWAGFDDDVHLYRPVDVAAEAGHRDGIRWAHRLLGRTKQRGPA